MKKYLFILFILVSSFVHAQEKDTTYWRNSFKGAISFNQASFSENWTAGGVNSIGLTGAINYKANYLKGKNSWDNQIDLQ